MQDKEGSQQEEEEGGGRSPAKLLRKSFYCTLFHDPPQQPAQHPSCGWQPLFLVHPGFQHGAVVPCVVIGRLQKPPIYRWCAYRGSTFPAAA